VDAPLTDVAWLGPTRHGPRRRPGQPGGALRAARRPSSSPSSPRASTCPGNQRRRSALRRPRLPPPPRSRHDGHLDRVGEQPPYSGPAGSWPRRSRPHPAADAAGDRRARLGEIVPGTRPTGRGDAEPWSRCSPRTSPGRSAAAALVPRSGGGDRLRRGIPLTGCGSWRHVPTSRMARRRWVLPARDDARAPGWSINVLTLRGDGSPRSPVQSGSSTSPIRIAHSLPDPAGAGRGRPSPARPGSCRPGLSAGARDAATSRAPVAHLRQPGVERTELVAEQPPGPGAGTTPSPTSAVPAPAGPLQRPTARTRRVRLDGCLGQRSAPPSQAPASSSTRSARCRGRRPAPMRRPSGPAGRSRRCLHGVPAGGRRARCASIRPYHRRRRRAPAGGQVAHRSAGRE